MPFLIGSRRARLLSAIILPLVWQTIVPAAAQRVTATISIPPDSAPGAIAVNPVTKKVYVGSATGTSVAIIDGDSATNAATFVHTGGNPMSFAIDSASDQVYVLNRDNTSTISRIDGATNAVTQMATLPRPAELFHALAVLTASNKTRLYASSPGDDTVNIVDATTREMTSVGVCHIPRGVYANPTAAKIYVLCENAIAVLEGMTVTATMSITGRPGKAASVDLLHNKLYVATESPTALLEIDGASNAVTPVALGNVLSAGDVPFDLVLHQSLQRVYLAVNYGANGNRLIIVDRVAQTATAMTVPFASALAIDESENRLFAIGAGNAASIIDPVAKSVVGVSLAGLVRPSGDPSERRNPRPSPQVVAVVAGTHKAYVASQTMVGTRYTGMGINGGNPVGEVAVIDPHAAPLSPVQVDRIEVSQTVQDVDQTVPFVATKPTVVRVFLSGGPVAGIGGVLAFNSGNSPPSYIASANDDLAVSATPPSLRARREDANQSLNFFLPPFLRSQNVFDITLAWPTDSAGGSAPCTNCATFHQRLAVGPPIEMRLHVVGLRYTGGEPTQTFEPRQIDYNLLQSWLKRGYPISSLVFTQMTTAIQLPPPNAPRATPFECEDANAQLIALRNQDVVNGTDQRTHYYGMVLEDRRNGSFFMRGCSSDLPAAADPSIVASGPTGPSGVEAPWDTDGSWGDWYGAHELGHTLGRSHAGPITRYRIDNGTTPPQRIPVGPCGEDYPDTAFPYPAGQIGPNDGSVVGTDLGDSAFGIVGGLVKVTVGRDVMSYCDYQWVGKYTYLALMNRLRAENALPARPTASNPQVAAVAPNAPGTAGAPASSGPSKPAGVAQNAGPHGQPAPVYEDGDFITIVGTANVTRQQALIRFVNRVQRAKIREADPASPVRLRAYDRDGNIVQDIPAVFLQNSHSESGEVRGVVEAVIPARAGLKAIELVIAGTVAARYEAPASTNLAPVELRATPAPPPVTAQAVGAPSPSVRLEWGTPRTAAAVPAAPPGVSYDVQASGDGGRTWQTLAVGLSAPDAQVDLSMFKDIREVDVRVIANGGFDSKVIAERKVQR